MAFILFFAASAALTIGGESRTAFELTHDARLRFERFAEDPLRHRIVRLKNVLPDAYLLEARSALAVRDRAGAGMVLRAMGDALFDGLGNWLRPAVKELHCAELHMALAEVLPHDEATGAWAQSHEQIDAADPHAAALRISGQVLDENFTNRRAWRLFLSEATPTEGVERIERTLESALSKPAGGVPEREALEWLEFQLAVTARQRAEEMPELVLEAFRAYLRLLVSQPRNLVALAELLDIYSDLDEPTAEGALVMLDEDLVPLSAQDPPPTHAALRWALRDETPDLEPGVTPPLALAIPVLGAGTAAEDTLALAGEQLQSAITTTSRRLVPGTLELISKWVYEEGRVSADRERLMAVERLLEPATAALPEDPVWWTRRADVAMAMQDTELADDLLARIDESLQDDPIAQLQRGRLLLLKGELSEADKALITAESLDREMTGENVSHPAISDRRGFIACSQGRYRDAEDLYIGILAENPADPSAHYGLGRVFRNDPEGRDALALSEWRAALRLRATGSNAHARHFAWRAAAGIAALVDQRVKVGDAAEPLAGLEELLGVEDVAVSRYVIKALRVRGVIDRATVEAVRCIPLPGLAASLAQYYMARAVHVYIERPAEWASFVDGELPVYVEWCRRENVLGDFVAGAKGSYARAQMRSSTWAQGLAPEVVAESSPVKARKLRKLVEHVVETSYSSSYYQDAYRFLRSAKGASDEQLVATARTIVERMAEKARRSLGTDLDRGLGWDRLLTSLRPSIGLEPIGAALKMEGSAVNLIGYVDLDALLFARFTKGLREWRVEGAHVTATAEAELSAAERRGYGRAGLMWDVREGRGLRCAVSMIESSNPAEMEVDNAEAEGLVIA